MLEYQVTCLCRLEQQVDAPFRGVITHGENTRFLFTISKFKGLLTNVDTVCIVVISFRPFHLIYYIY